MSPTSYSAIAGYLYTNDALQLFKHVYPDRIDRRIDHGLQLEAKIENALAEELDQTVLVQQYSLHLHTCDNIRCILPSKFLHNGHSNHNIY